MAGADRADDVMSVPGRAAPRPLFTLPGAAAAPAPGATRRGLPGAPGDARAAAAGRGNRAGSAAGAVGKLQTPLSPQPAFGMVFFLVQPRVRRAGARRRGFLPL